MTLVLIAVVVVAGILVAIAVPAFNNFVQNDRDATQINFLSHSLNYARSVAVSLNGGGPGVACWETHFERGKGTDWDDLHHPLANTPDNVGSFALGDYDHVLAIGEKFYGAFSASNYPDKSNFHPDVRYQRHVDWNTHKLYADAAHTIVVAPSTDPFMFSVEE